MSNWISSFFRRRSASKSKTPKRREGHRQLNVEQLEDRYMLSGVSLIESTFFGGAGDQRGTDVEIQGSDIYVSVNANESGPSASSFLVKYSAPTGPSTTPVFSKAWALGTLNGIGIDGANVYGAGFSHPGAGLTNDGTGGTETKTLLTNFDADNVAGTGPDGSNWAAIVPQGTFNSSPGTSYFVYNGEESYRDTIAVDDAGSTFIYAAGLAQPCSHNVIVVGKYDTSGQIVAGGTDPTVGVNFNTCAAPGGPGGGQGSAANAVVELNGNIYLVGHADNYGNGGATIWKHDANLDFVWKQLNANNGDFRGVTVLDGYIYAAGVGGADYLIHKYDEAGNLIWSAVSGGAGTTEALNDIYTIDGRLFATGYTDGSGAGGEDIVVMEIDASNGNIISTVTYGGAQNDRGNRIASDGTDLYVIGESRSFAEGGNAVGQNDAVLLRYSLGATPANPGPEITSLSIDQAMILENESVTLSGEFTDPSNSVTTTVFFEDFESYAAGSNLIGQGGWTLNPNSTAGGTKTLVEFSSGLGSLASHGRFDTGEGALVFADNILAAGGGLANDRVYTLNFNALAFSGNPGFTAPAHNAGVYFRDTSNANAAGWFMEATGNNVRWIFDVRSLTGSGSNLQSFAFGQGISIPQTPTIVDVNLSVVLDPMNNEVFGLADFGDGILIETTRFAMSNAQFATIDGVLLHQDYRNPPSFRGAEFDDILVTSSTTAFEGHTIVVDWDDPNNTSDSTFALDATNSLAPSYLSTSGDGAVLTITAVNTTTGEVSFSVEHQYLDDGVAPGNNTSQDDYTINVSVTDDDGANSVDLTGTWSSTATLNQTRNLHTATLLDDGRLLVVGGLGATSTSAEVYDPATDTWTPTGTSTTDQRNGATAIRLNDGRVLVTGGRPGFIGLTSAEIYDPVADTWTDTGSMNDGRILHTLTLLQDGRVLVAGGYETSFLNSAEIYDPATGVWTPTGSLATGRWNHTAQLLSDGRVLVAAGENYAFCPTCSLATAEIYDPTTGTWSLAASLNDARTSHISAMLPDGKVLVAGGMTNANFNSPVMTAELYDPVANTWTLTGSLNDARQGRGRNRSAQLPDGRVVISDGFEAGPGLIANNSLEVYDPATGTWSLLANLNQGRIAHTLSALADGSLIVVGGRGDFNSTTHFDSAEILNSASSATVTVKNVAPDFEAGPNNTLPPGSGAFSRTGITFTDSGTLDVHTVKVDYDGDTIIDQTINLPLGDRTFDLSHTYTASGTFTVSVTVEDDDTGTLTDTFAVMVALNTSPTTSGITNVNVLEDAPDTVIDLFAAFADAEDADAALTYTVESNTNPSLFTSTIVNGGVGTLTLDYAPDANGTADIKVRATDTGGLFVETIVTVTVTAVNDEPAVVLPQLVDTTDEDTPLTISGVTVFDIDAGSDPIAMSLSVNNGSLSLTNTTGLTFSDADGSDGTLAFTGSQTDITTAFGASIVYTPAPDFNSSEQLLPSNLVSWLNADSNSGTTAFDIQGTNDGTLVNGATITPAGQVGDAFEFDGVNDYLEIPTNGFSPSAMTTALWFKPKSWSGHDDLVQHSTDGFNQNRISLERGGGFAGCDGDRMFLVTGNASGSLSLLCTTTSFELDTWYHVAASFDSVGNTAIYVNGVLENSASSAVVPTAIDSSFFVGLNFGNDTSRFLDGFADEVQIYDRVLTAEEVESIFNSGTTLTITANDQGSTGLGGPQQDSKQLPITVNPVNDEPTFTALNPPAVNEDAGAQVVNGWASFDPGAANESAQSVLAYTVSNFSNLSLFDVSPTVDASGNLTYTPAADANGTSTFDIQVQDNGGTANGGDDTSQAQTFTITVNSVNDEPDFTTLGDQTVNEDSGAHVFAGFATASPGGGPDEAGQTFMYNVTNDNSALFTTGPAIDANGELTFTLAADTNGLANVMVSVTDSGGAANGGDDTSPTQTFQIEVLSAQDQLDNLIDDVLDDLVSNGPLNNGQGNALTSKLQNAINKLDQGNTNAGINQLQAFINQVNSLVNSGKLTPAEAQPSIDAANAAIASALPGSPLLASSIGNQAPSDTVNVQVVKASLGDAVAHWLAEGINPVALARASSVPIYVMNLPGQYLGAASSSAIWIDNDAAGHGWSVGRDNTNTQAAGRMDLLTALSHEFGHVLGFGHEHGVMAPYLDVGVTMIRDVERPITRYISGGFNYVSSSGITHILPVRVIHHTLEDERTRSTRESVRSDDLGLLPSVSNYASILRNYIDEKILYTTIQWEEGNGSTTDLEQLLDQIRLDASISHDDLKAR